MAFVLRDHRPGDRGAWERLFAVCAARDDWPVAHIDGRSEPHREWPHVDLVAACPAGLLGWIVGDVILEPDAAGKVVPLRPWQGYVFAIAIHPAHRPGASGARCSRQPSIATATRAARASNCAPPPRTPAVSTSPAAAGSWPSVPTTASRPTTSGAFRAGRRAQGVDHGGRRSRDHRAESAAGTEGLCAACPALDGGSIHHALGRAGAARSVPRVELVACRGADAPFGA